MCWMNHSRSCSSDGGTPSAAERRGMVGVLETCWRLRLSLSSSNLRCSSVNAEIRLVKSSIGMLLVSHLLARRRDTLREALLVLCFQGMERLKPAQNRLLLQPEVDQAGDLVDP